MHESEYLGVPVQFAGPATEHFIQSVEIAAQAPLPSDLRKLLAVADGCDIGSPAIVDPKTDCVIEYSKEWGFPATAEMDWFSPTVIVHRIFGVSPKDCMLRYWNDFDFSFRVGPGIIPIGSAGSEQFVAMSLREEDYGAVYFWKPPELHDDSRDGVNRSLYRCADSFGSWWLSLREVEDEDEDDWE